MRWCCSLTIAFVIQSPLSPELTVSSPLFSPCGEAKCGLAGIVTITRLLGDPRFLYARCCGSNDHTG